VRPIDLGGFEDTFSRDDDPWRTFSDRDEALKRAAIMHGLGGRILGRVLELGAGNGSNSVAIADRALRLEATEGTEAGTRLVERALAGNARARAVRLALPGRFPRATYDAVVVAELLYYLSIMDLNQVARDVAKGLAPGGCLVLAHHRIDFHDFAQHAEGIHARFLAATGVKWRPQQQRRTGRWRVQSYRMEV